MPVTRKGKLNGVEAKLENSLKRGLILSGMLVAQRASGLAPIDTGRLKRSITNSMPKQVGRLSYRVDVGTNVEYAMAQEFGVGARAEDPSKSKVPARLGNYPHPYLRPAINKSRKEITQLIAKNIVAAFR